MLMEITSFFAELAEHPGRIAESADQGGPTP
jgi:hypothetical protein